MMNEPMTDQEAFDFYADEVNRAPEGEPRRRASKLTEVVPVRVTESTLDAIRERAERADQSISAWVRSTLAEALEEPANANRHVASGSYGMGKSAVFTNLELGATSPVALGHSSVTVDVADVLSKHLVRWATDYEEVLESVVDRIEAGLVSEPVERLFEVPYVVDADSIQYRTVNQFEPVAATARSKRSELEATQRAMMTLFRTSALPPIAPEDVLRVRERLQSLRSRLSQTARQTQDASREVRSGLWPAREMYIEMFESTRRFLRQLDDELFLVEQDSRNRSAAEGTASDRAHRVREGHG